jgi:O-antigen ligase
MGFILVWKGMKIEWVFLSSLIGFLAISIIALIHVQIDGDWLEESYIGARGWGNYLIVAMPILLYFLIKNISYVSIAVALALVVFLFYIGILSEVRMVWLVLLVQAFVALGLYVKVNSIGTKEKIIVSLLVVAVLVAGMTTMQYVNKVRKGKDLHVSVVQDSRIERWPGVIKIIQESPYYGLGFGKSLFGQEYPEFQEGDRHFKHAHNLLLDYGLMLGVPGILVIILLFISMLVFFYRGIEKDVLLSSVALVLIIGLLAKNMTDDFFIKDVSLTFWMLLGILSGVIATKRDDLSSNV